MLALDLNGARAAIFSDDQAVAPHSGNVAVDGGGRLNADSCSDLPHARAIVVTAGVVIDEAQDLHAGFFVGRVAHG